LRLIADDHPGGVVDRGEESATDAGGRPVVYLLHGLLGTAYGHFGPQIVAWRGRYRLVPVDLPGHGRCVLDAADAYCDQAFGYVLSAMRRFGRGHVVAASYLGGPLAVRAARDHPELVDTLTLTGFVPGLPKAIFETWCAAFLQVADGRAELCEKYDSLHGTRWRRTLDAFSADAQRRYEARILVTDEMLGALEQPTLIANGSWKSLEREAAERASAWGPRMDGRVIHGGGHLPCYDRPEAFNATAETFWDAVAAP
jgi:pimeloyl-ACP methyl ester carboxylesterase